MIRSHRTAIITCSNFPDKLAVISISVEEETTLLGIDDPTGEPNRTYSRIPNRTEPARIYSEILAKSVEKGCRLIYNGARNFG